MVVLEFKNRVHETGGKGGTREAIQENIVGPSNVASAAIVAAVPRFQIRIMIVASN